MFKSLLDRELSCLHYDITTDNKADYIFVLTLVYCVGPK